MKRFHLFEFEDQTWFPTIIRNYMTDYLQFATNKMDFYNGVIDVLKKGLSKTENNTIIDLASGGGGGWLKLSEHLHKELPNSKVIFSDYYPNINAFKYNVDKIGNNFSYNEASVNALEVPQNLKGFRTMFLSFHHFQPKDAQQILQNAVNAQQPIAVFEAQERSISQFIQFFFSPIFVLLMTPFIRPFSLGRLFFTYLIPLVPLFVWWDGLVSVLRTYSVDEMTKMTKDLKKGDTFDWEIAKIKSGPAEVQYLIGTPK